jgi:hypothetical protein
LEKNFGWKKILCYSLSTDGPRRENRKKRREGGE